MKIWIARDADGVICLFKEKPKLDDRGYWRDGTCKNDEFYAYAELDKTDFPSVTFENSPQQVEIKLINDECDK